MDSQTERVMVVGIILVIALGMFCYTVYKIAELFVKGCAS